MFNAGSLMRKLDELNNLASLSHIDVKGVTETCLHDDHEFSLPGFPPRPSEKEELLST